ncbi:hypothetical protein [Pseudarthrobacter sp. Y6]|uniref:hypothetical protein n=1 Tax=Pseudarthrobacter sp. Y6 TaxID=3418422 RepID=UPI003CF00C59
MTFLEWPVGHFAFDGAGDGALSALGQELVQELVEDFLAENGEGFSQFVRGQKPGARRGIAVVPGGSV